MGRKLFSAIVFLIGSIFFICECSAQSNLSLGAKGGISIPNLKGSSDNPVSRGWSTRLGPYVGIMGELQINNRFSLQGELNYSSQGGKKNGTLAIPTDQFIKYFGIDTTVAIPYIYMQGKTEAKLVYIELPVFLKLNLPLGKILTLFIDGGPYAGYLIDAENVTTGTSNIYSDENLTQPLLPVPVSLDQTIKLTNDLRKFNWGIQGGIGLSLHLSYKSKLELACGGNYGLVHIQKDKTNGSNTTGAASFTLGYMVQID